MITLYNDQTGAELGTISAEQLQFLLDHLEEESESDEAYYIDTATVDMLADQGAEAGLISVLRGALGASGDAEVRWKRH